MSEFSGERARQDPQGGEDDWKETMYSGEPPPRDDAQTGPSVTLEGTLTVVTENIWSLGDAALKSVAEVLVGFGISPSILGYSEEELLEEEEALEAAWHRIQKDEVLSKSSFARRSEEHMSRRRADDAEAEAEGEEPCAKEDLRPAGWGSTDDLAEEGFEEDKKDK